MTIKIVVPISGGKDSQACLHLARQRHPAESVIGLFCDTGFEHPLTYAHIEWMRSHYGIRVDTIRASDVLTQCERFKRFPGGRSRHCTDYLKIRPSLAYYKALALQLGHGFEVWYGMRSAESNDRKQRYAGKVDTLLYAPHEVMKKYPQYLSKRLNVWFRLPVIDLTTADILKMLDGKENPLYKNFERVGCFPCLAAGDKYKKAAFDYDEFGASQLAKVMQTSRIISKPIYTSKSHAEFNAPPCAMCID